MVGITSQINETELQILASNDDLIFTVAEIVDLISILSALKVV